MNRSGGNHRCLQNFELKNEKILAAFTELKNSRPERFAERFESILEQLGVWHRVLIRFSETAAASGIGYIELKGNHHGPDLGYGVKDTLRILAEHDLKVSGICGMFSVECDLSSNRPFHRQTALEYLKREIEFAAADGRFYILINPSFGALAERKLTMRWSLNVYRNVVNGGGFILANMILGCDRTDPFG